MKLSKQLGQTQEENRKQDHYIDKLRHVVSKLNQVSTGVKFQKAEFVHREDLVAVKSQINQAFRTLMALHEDAITRDSVIVESLLETQLGKLRRLIVKRDTHNDLLDFSTTL